MRQRIKTEARTRTGVSIVWFHTLPHTYSYRRKSSNLRMHTYSYILLQIDPRARKTCTHTYTCVHTFSGYRTIEDTKRRGKDKKYKRNEISFCYNPKR